MSIKLVDFDKHAAQVANDLFYQLIGEPAGLYGGEGDIAWNDAHAVILGLPEGMALYGIIAREFDAHNMVPFGILEINSQESFEAMQKEMDRLRRSWIEQFGFENFFCAAGAYAIAEKGLLDN